MEEFIVELQDVTKTFKDFNAIKSLNLNVRKGEFLTLLGPSGCGKTTTLRMIAGFEKPTKGNICINGEKVNKIEPFHREINTVFQHYSLFPHMTIFKNVAFGLKMKKIKKKEINDRVNQVLEMVQLKHLAKRKPKQLSGGQQQRIAIARAIVNNPKVLLLDEPLGALDLKLRKQMQLELKRLQESLGITFIYVTHDQEEALTMSDRIVVMNEGSIAQLDSARNIYEKPQSLFVADFIGETNIIEAILVEQQGDNIEVKIGENTFSLPVTEDLDTNEKVHLSIRPEKINFSSDSTVHSNQMTTVIKEIIYSGAITKINVELPDQQIVTVQSSNGSSLKEGDFLYIYWETEHVSIHHPEKESVFSNEKEAINI